MWALGCVTRGEFHRPVVVISFVMIDAVIDAVSAAVIAAVLSKRTQHRRSTTIVSRGGEIAAAWQHGDVGAAFIWRPVLWQLRANGKAGHPGQQWVSARSAARRRRPMTIRETKG